MVSVRRRISHELSHHAPFTLLGAATGVLLISLIGHIPTGLSYRIFYILHPVHVFLSALVTASIYQIHQRGGVPRKGNFLTLLLIGYTGAIGVATVSDSLIPYLGEILLRMPHSKPHIGFLEEWWLVNSLAVLGVLAAYLHPLTRHPHAGHVLLSTWASLFHIVMAMGQSVGGEMYVAIFLFLFLAVWVPCCVSDIIFPLLFVKRTGGNALPGCKTC